MMSSVARTVSSLWGEERADGSHAPGVITEQILRPWALYQGADPRTVPLALRRVPDLDEDARLEAESSRAEAWRLEVRELRALGYEVTDKEARELAEARGVRLPAGLVMSVPTPPPPPVPDPSAPVPDEDRDAAEEEQAA
jgi:CBS domain-containing protein